MTIPSGQCLKNYITEFRHGSMSEAQQQAFENHLDHCEQCREKLDGVFANEYQWRELRYALSTVGPTSAAETDRGSCSLSTPKDLSALPDLFELENDTHGGDPIITSVSGNALISSTESPKSSMFLQVDSVPKLWL